MLRLRASGLATVALVLVAASCASALERARTRYRQDRDDGSLQTIARAPDRLQHFELMTTGE